MSSDGLVYEVLLRNDVKIHPLSVGLRTAASLAYCAGPSQHVDQLKSAPDIR
jgi:hypothetical protein